MKFVAPETVRLTLSDGQWIEVKKSLSAIEEKRYRSAGMKRMSHRKGDNDEPTNEVEIDWTAMALARVVTYLVEWSARDEKDRQVPVSRDTIGQLDQESFDEIDTAIQAHIEQMDAEKKARSGKPSLTAV